MSLDEIYTRRSIRKYQNKKVPIEIINEIINAGIVAPSGKNKQPWRFLVFSGEKKDEIVQKMKDGIIREKNGVAILPESAFGIPDAENTVRIMEEAPVIIFVMNFFGTSPFDDISTDKRVTEIVDSLSIGAAVQNMLIKAEELGIGTLWIGNTFFAYTELAQYIKDLTLEEHQITCAIALGYADEKPNKRYRKSIEEVTKYYL